MTRPGQASAPDPIVLRYPFRGRWRARNSPARRVPSHGTHLFGTTYAIDFIAVDEKGLSAPLTLRAVFATEEPESFTGFGAPILAPVSGRVVALHDGAPDHEARRSFALVPYMLTQAERARAGGEGLAGNHVVIAVPGSRSVYVAVAHLRRGSVRVRLGQEVEAGDVVGECGNSGNSTQPHVHVQAVDSMHWETARGLPITFGDSAATARLPEESEIIDVT